MSTVNEEGAVVDNGAEDKEEAFFADLGGEPDTPDADSFLEEALRGEGGGDGGETGKPGDQSPEAVPGEGSADAAKKNTGANDDRNGGADDGKGGAEEDQKELEAFDKIEKPSGEDWKRAREAMKRQAQRLREMQQGGGKKSDEPAAGAERGGEDRGNGGGTPPAVDPAAVFDTLARTVSGEETRFQRGDIETYIQSRMTPWQVKQVIDAARAGKFGEASDEVLALANEQLPLVIASESQNRERAAREAAVRTERERASQELREAFPELKTRDEKNPVFAEVDAACRELEAVIPGFQQVPAAPRVVKQFVEMRRASARAEALAKENAGYKAEIERLTKLVGHAAKPPAGGGKDAGQQATSADDWLKEQIDKGAFTAAN
jgi:hypothetical protein